MLGSIMVVELDWSSKKIHCFILSICNTSKVRTQPSNWFFCPCVIIIFFLVAVVGVLDVVVFPIWNKLNFSDFGVFIIHCSLFLFLWRHWEDFLPPILQCPYYLSKRKFWRFITVFIFVGFLLIYFLILFICWNDGYSTTYLHLLWFLHICHTKGLLLYQVFILYLIRVFQIQKCKQSLIGLQNFKKKPCPCQCTSQYHKSEKSTSTTVNSKFQCRFQNDAFSEVFNRYVPILFNSAICMLVWWWMYLLHWLTAKELSGLVCPCRYYSNPITLA